MHPLPPLKSAIDTMRRQVDHLALLAEVILNQDAFGTDQAAVNTEFLGYCHEHLMRRLRPWTHNEDAFEEVALDDDMGAALLLIRSSCVTLGSLVIDRNDGREALRKHMATLRIVQAGLRGADVLVGD
jgi:hypothetical protein